MIKYIFIIFILFACNKKEQISPKVLIEHDGDVLRPPEGYNPYKLQPRKPIPGKIVLDAEGISSSEIKLTWTTTEQGPYNVYRMFSKDGGYGIATVSNKNYTVTGLYSGQTDSFSVRTTGKNKNSIAISNNAAATTYILPGTGQNAMIYLNFEGKIVSNTVWNYAGDIVCAPANLTTSEQNYILDSMRREYAKLGLPVSINREDYDNADRFKRMEIIFTESWEWYGYVGGVAYIGSFNWGTDTPCFVFSSLLNYSPSNNIRAGIHEAGHTLNLYHTDAGVTQNYGNWMTGAYTVPGWYGLAIYLSNQINQPELIKSRY